MIYFIQQGDAGPIKIGYTQYNVASRLSTIQSGNPQPLRCIATLDGTLADEYKLHRQFSDFHIRGEWFDPSPALLGFIQAHAVPSKTAHRVYAGVERRGRYQPLVIDRK
jgi:hypothetical protein